VLVTVVMLYPFWFMARTSLFSLSQYYLGRGVSISTGTNSSPRFRRPGALQTRPLIADERDSR